MLCQLSLYCVADCMKNRVDDAVASVMSTIKRMLWLLPSVLSGHLKNILRLVIVEFAVIFLMLWYICYFCYPLVGDKHEMKRSKK